MKLAVQRRLIATKGSTNWSAESKDHPPLDDVVNHTVQKFARAIDECSLIDSVESQEDRLFYHYLLLFFL